MVNLPEDWISPPVRVRPEADERPPVVLTESPPENEEVALSVEVILPEV